MGEVVRLGRRLRHRLRGRRAGVAHFQGVERLTPRRRMPRLAALPLVPVLLLVFGLAGSLALTSWPAPGAGGLLLPRQEAPLTRQSFRMCTQAPHRDCVIDGDTFYLGSQSVRVADIDAPETHPPRCALERRLGEAATRRLQVLLNAGPFELRTGARASDRYGRWLRTVHRDGSSLGAVLVAEGLARAWTGRREPWCG